MMKRMIAMTAGAVLASGAYGQGAAAVYDATNHAQNVINHKEVLVSHQELKNWLSNLLQQLKTSEQTLSVFRTETQENFKKAADKFGDPATYRANLTGVATGQSYSNQKLSVLRNKGIASTGNTECNAEMLYGAKAKPGAAERVVEAAYVNYETVLEGAETDRLALMRKREELVNQMENLKNLAHLSKHKAAIALVDSKLASLAEVEKNAALKVLVLKARNDVQRELKTRLEEQCRAHATIAATSSMDELRQTNFSKILQEK